MKLLKRLRQEFGTKQEIKPRRRLRKATSRRPLAPGAMRLDNNQPIFEQLRGAKNEY